MALFRYLLAGIMVLFAVGMFVAIIQLRDGQAGAGFAFMLALAAAGYGEACRIEHNWKNEIH